MSTVRELPLNKYIISGDNDVVKLVLNEEGFYEDAFGTIFALRDGKSLDPVERCGVWPFSLSPKHIVTPACKVHDAMYEMPVYQFFYTREEADKYLLKCSLFGFPYLGKVFYKIARIFGSKYWDNPDTNN